MALMYWFEWFDPAKIGKAGWAKMARLNTAVGVVGGLLYIGQQSTCEFSWSRNERIMDAHVVVQIDSMGLRRIRGNRRWTCGIWWRG